MSVSKGLTSINYSEKAQKKQYTETANKINGLKSQILQSLGETLVNFI